MNRHKWAIGQFENEYGELFIILKDKKGNHYFVGDETSWEVLPMLKSFDESESFFNMDMITISKSKNNLSSFLVNKGEFEEIKKIINKSA